MRTHFRGRRSRHASISGDSGNHLLDSLFTCFYQTCAFCVFLPRLSPSTFLIRCFFSASGACRDLAFLRLSPNCKCLDHD